MVACQFKHDCNSANVVAPMMAGFRTSIVEVKFNPFGKVVRENRHHAIGPRSDRDCGSEADGDRHYKPIVIVSMFSDQVDPARSAKDACACGLRFYLFTCKHSVS